MAHKPTSIHAVSLGKFRLDGGAMFGIVPKPLWSRKAESDEKNRCLLETRCLLLKYPDRTVLIEGGSSLDFGDKKRDIYGIEGDALRGVESWRRALASHGVGVDDITDVILTHLHFDHAGGLSYLEAGVRKPTFKNAKHYVQAKHLEWALNPSAKDQGSFLEEGLFVFQENAVAVETLHGDQELWPGIRVQCVHGHTTHQQVVHIDVSFQGKDRNLVFVADLIPTVHHVSKVYNMAYDNEPLKSTQEKSDFVEKAMLNNWILWFYHDPTIQAGTLTGEGRSTQIQPVEII